MLDRLVELLISGLNLFRFWVVLDPYEKGVLLRLGRFIRVIEPGLTWVWPFDIDHVLTESVVMQTKSLGNLATTTVDGKKVGFECIVSYKISDIQKALLTVYRVEDAILDACQGVVGTTISTMTWDELRDTEKTTDKISIACRKRGWRYGVEILTAQLAGVSLVHNIRLMGDYHHTERQI